MRKSKIQKKIFFSDIDGVIWPEVPVLLAFAKHLFPRKKGLLINKFSHLSVKAEKHNPPILTSNQVNKIFNLYEKQRIFRFSLKRLKNLISHFNSINSLTNFSEYIKNVNFFKNEIKKKNLVHFITSRNNYKSKENIKGDTEIFLNIHKIKSNLDITSNKISKGDIIVSTIKKKSLDRKYFIVLVEDNILDLFFIIDLLKKNKITIEKAYIIDNPWNRFENKKEEFIEILLSKNISKGMAVSGFEYLINLKKSKILERVKSLG